MKKEVLVPTLLIVLTQLSACIEVRDNRQADKQPAQVLSMVPVEKFGDLVIDEVMYVYDGKILNTADLEQARKDNAYFKKNVGHDFEFKYDRLTITERGALYTLGNNVRLHVRDLKTQSGTVATFPESQAAPENQEGRSGGHILIDVERGEGVLQIVMRGERGGKGIDGEKPDASMRGEAGAPGPNGDPWGNNGICSSVAGPGKEGGPGKPGHPGKPGRRGGDTGTLEVRIQNEENFTYSIQRKPGQGGPGGLGGLGGQGGPNGAHGTASFSCGGFTLDGPGQTHRGPDGKPGDPGAPGTDGVNQTVCLTKNNTTSCY